MALKDNKINIKKRKKRKTTQWFSKKSNWKINYNMSYIIWYQIINKNN